MDQARKILLIEDDLSICEVITHHLNSNGFQVICEHDGPSGLQKALDGDHILVILDLNLPRLSGIDICKAVRRKRENLPLIMLTARDSEMDKVLGLEVGADDYIVKPFSMYELMARIRARLRIASPTGSAGMDEVSQGRSMQCGSLCLYPDTRTATLGEANLELTVKEFDVLQYLLQNQQRVISRDELLRAIWGSTVAAYADSVTSLVSRLRRKMEQLAPDSDYIQTVRGIGFRIFNPAEAKDQTDSNEKE